MCKIANVCNKFSGINSRIVYICPYIPTFSADGMNAQGVS